MKLQRLDKTGLGEQISHRALIHSGGPGLSCGHGKFRVVGIWVWYSRVKVDPGKHQTQDFSQGLWGSSMKTVFSGQKPCQGHACEPRAGNRRSTGKRQPQSSSGMKLSFQRHLPSDFLCGPMQATPCLWPSRSTVDSCNCTGLDLREESDPPRVQD